MIWVLVDLSWLAYRALHAVGNLEHEDIPTGIIFGFFTQLREICNDPKVQSNRVAIFCDSRKSYRAEVYPDYKRKRREERDEEKEKQIRAMREQMNLLQGGILAEIGFPVYKQEGLESDDLLAYVARHLTLSTAFGGPRKRGVMITSDGDLYQSITHAVHWYDPQRRRYYTPDDFKTLKGVDPAHWGMVKAIGGCSSDNVKGIPGIGEVTAVKYLTNKLPEKHKTYQRIVSAEGRKVIKRNKGLVVLPHAKTEPVVLKDPQYDLDVFFGYCERFGLATFLNRDRKAWAAFFNRREFVPRKRGERREKGKGFGL